MLYEKNIFRLSAILYADQNYNVSTKLIIKKIVESVFLELDKSTLSIHDIIDYCEQKYALQFDYEEIKKIVDDEKDNSFTVYYTGGGELFVQILETRRKTILSKISKSSIEQFIISFSNIKSMDEKVLSDLIYRFLYYIINNNQVSFLKLLNTSKNYEIPNDMGNVNFSIEERILINEFLNWDNDEKNKSMFDILSYSVEYCLLVSNNRDSVHLNMLKNKKFYLDANIIYRIIGINGIERQKRTETFIKKCTELGISLFISKFTDAEFIESIKNNILRMKQFGGKKLDSSVFYQYANNFDIYDFYYHWREKRVDANYKAYQNHILALYESFKKQYNVSIDYKIPFDLNEKKHEEQIKLYSNQIRIFKDPNVSSTENGACYIDAENIYLIEQRRSGLDSNLSESKYFIISTDQSLRKWDYQQSISTPRVMHPSQWLSIVLRYVSRTKDDYKSFVSFLNIKAVESFKDNHTLHIIISAISETTEDLEKQKELVNVIIESQFKDLIEGNPSDEEIFNRTMEFAQIELNNKLSVMSEKVSELNEKIIIAQSEINVLSDSSKNQSDRILSLTSNNDELKNELKSKHLKNELRKWKLPAYFSILAVVVLICFYLLHILFTDWPNNFIYKIILSVDKIESGLIKNLLYAIDIGIAALFLPLLKLIYNRLLSKKHLSSFTDNIKYPLNYE
jgi:hypothetical protein